MRNSFVAIAVSFFLAEGCCSPESEFSRQYKQVLKLQACDVKIFNGILIHGRLYQGRYNAGKFIKYINGNEYNLPSAAYLNESPDSSLLNRVYRFAREMRVNKQDAIEYTNSYTTKVIQEYYKTDAEEIFSPEGANTITFFYPGSFFVVHCEDISKIKDPTFKARLSKGHCLDRNWYFWSEASDQNIQ
jgi:hypothetical protein